MPEQINIYFAGVLHIMEFIGVAFAAYHLALIGYQLMAQPGKRAEHRESLIGILAGLTLVFLAGIIAQIISTIPH